MHNFINSLVVHNLQNRKFILIENGSWAPTATKVMTKMLEKCKDLTYTESTVRIMSALNEDSEKQLKALADELS